MTLWVRDGDVSPAGDVSPDTQLTTAWSVRFRRADDPTRAVTVAYYGCDPDPMGGSPAEALVIEEQVELVVGTNPDDLGGTEVWCDYWHTSFRRELGWFGLMNRTALAYARVAAESGADWIDWDGEPGWARDVHPLSDSRFDVFERIDREAFGR